MVAPPPPFIRNAYGSIRKVEVAQSAADKAVEEVGTLTSKVELLEEEIVGLKAELAAAS